jgi:hypothetical protein
MNEQEEQVPVSETDALTVERDEKPHEVRRLGDYKPTNTPLPAVEVQERETLCDKKGDDHAWPRRTTKTIHDIVPIEEHDPVLALGIKQRRY